MMSMQAMDELREMLCKELDEISRKGELGAGDLDIVHKLTDTIKNIDKIEMLEDDGYSRDGAWEADMRDTYGRGNSYTSRRGTHYVKGHYSRRGTDGYSRTDSIEAFRDRAREMMRNASGEEREVLQRCVDALDRA